MTLARKVYLQLPTPSPADLRADRERVLEAFHADSMTLSAMQTLYPTLKKANYAVTASLSPTDTGWEIRNIEAGDTRSRSCALALDLGSTTLEMELLDLNTGHQRPDGHFHQYSRPHSLRQGPAGPPGPFAGPGGGKHQHSNHPLLRPGPGGPVRNSPAGRGRQHLSLIHISEPTRH